MKSISPLQTTNGYLLSAILPKGLLLLLLAIILSWSPLTLAAKDKTTVGLLVGISGLGDQSFNDATYAGLFKAKQEFNLRLIYEDSVKSDTAFEASMKRLIDNGAQIIIANGFYLKELVEQYAAKYPDHYFILHDAVVENKHNVVCVQYAVDEGSFLAGALAGMMTKTGHVGFIGGVDIPIMHTFRIGFTAGVRYVNPEAEIRAEFVTREPDLSGFSMPERGYEMARASYADGTDIIYAAAGLTGNGVVEAARKAGKFAIGVDSDQDHLAVGYVLSSMLKRLDIATYNEVREIIEGRFQPGSKLYGLKENGVGLSPMKYTRHLIPAEYLTRLQNIQQGIIDGVIEIPGWPEPGSSAEGK